MIFKDHDLGIKLQLDGESKSFDVDFKHLPSSPNRGSLAFPANPPFACKGKEHLFISFLSQTWTKWVEDTSE